jgi:hypothetical protein
MRLAAAPSSSTISGSTTAGGESPIWRMVQISATLA